MAELVIKLPDIGEGVAEAELVEWQVQVGDLVREDDTLAAVMTDKATVEIPAPRDGTVAWLGAEVGEKIAVGAPLAKLTVAGEGDTEAESAAEPEPAREQEAEAAEAPAAPPEPQPAKVRTKEADAEPPVSARPGPVLGGSALPRPEGERPLASPAVRLRAREAGIDLRQVQGTGPAGRITHEDLDTFTKGGTALGRLQRRTEVEEIRIIGLRRRIAERMTLAKDRIAHITYVEEVDVTALEDLRGKLNAEDRDGLRLTILPFLILALVRAVEEQPLVNALFDDEAGILHRHAAVHVGIATQTPGGLMVPVVRHAEARGLRDCAAELARVTAAARDGSARQEELSGSTITITSLGALGGIMSTPIINHPEVAIVGVNKIAVRPHWDGQGFVPRKMMNLSSSFDHRVIDGWNAASFVQRLKTLLETPAMLFMEVP
ncbi:dihydrolipoamide acetyltransferase family protein [Aquibaculum arenosum]|uniref:Dihydrolipoamide acetyltransferase component of pyruvate dehydrogenase complex n=1 Tax=Aquibaculum arenosum TaxID=3032591 RepID=A0ABT5YME2_9PROT|nr:dihydrolipoamide acetyltransferase family protein [Fodinicurvata sp. CAU 1616]MDF2096133.1 dihydrolipoamide acetyltransferase family protein [Fodinicurvata sp. CAU 1616]